MTKKQKYYSIIGFIIAVIIGTYILYTLLDRGIIWFVYPSQNEFPVQGIDVSHHQGEIDWEAVADQDIRFVFMKATEGYGFVDKRFEQNWNEARSEGLLVGAYHFYSWRFSGDIQAENFIKIVPQEADALPPVIDLEFSGNAKARPSQEKLKEDLTIFIQKIEEHYGQTPILYVTREFYEDYSESLPHNSVLWVRSLFHSPQKRIFPEWTFWQYKNRGRVEGINGFVDLNVFYGNEKDFQKFIQGK